MLPQKTMSAQKTIREVYDGFVKDYAIRTRAHDDSILAATKARTRFITADRQEIRALKETLTSNANLIKRSDIYRTHLKYCKFLARRLLTWNAELRSLAEKGSLDDTELLRYGTTCYQFMTAASAVAVMNLRGMKARDACERKYDRVDRIRKKKLDASEAGLKAYAEQAQHTKGMMEFHEKLEVFARGIESCTQAPDVPKKARSFSHSLDTWVETVEKRIQTEMDKEEAARDWKRVCKTDVVRSGVDASAALEEEALIKSFEHMMGALGKRGNDWCPCCGAGCGSGSKKGSAHRGKA